MTLYRLTVRRADTASEFILRCASGAQLWDELNRIAREHPEGGTRIVVRNERCEIVISAGVLTLQTTNFRAAA